MHSRELTQHTARKRFKRAATSRPLLATTHLSLTHPADSVRGGAQEGFHSLLKRSHQKVTLTMALRRAHHHSRSLQHHPLIRATGHCSTILECCTIGSGDMGKEGGHPYLLPEALSATCQRHKLCDCQSRASRSVHNRLTNSSPAATAAQVCCG